MFPEHYWSNTSPFRDSNSLNKVWSFQKAKQNEMLLLIIHHRKGQCENLRFFSKPNVIFDLYRTYRPFLQLEIIFKISKIKNKRKIYKQKSRHLILNLQQWRVYKVFSPSSAHPLSLSHWLYKQEISITLWTLARSDNWKFCNVIECYGWQ